MVTYISKRSLTNSVIIVIFSCKEDSFPARYLEIPIKPDKLTKQDWAPLLDRLEIRLREWRGKHLSLGKVSSSS